MKLCLIRSLKKNRKGRRKSINQSKNTKNNQIKLIQTKAIKNKMNRK